VSNKETDAKKKPEEAIEYKIPLNVEILVKEGDLVKKETP